jgi:hypothetical protein
MRKSETRVIGDTSYTVTQLGGTVARGAAVKCGNLLGPGIKALKEGGASAAGQVLQDLTDDDLEYFCALFRPFTSVSTTKGKVLPLEPIFDEHFAGRSLGRHVPLARLLLGAQLPKFFSRNLRACKKASRRGAGSGKGERLDLSEDVDWFVWKLVTHPRLNVSLAEIETHWSLDDMLSAHESVDELDAAEARAEERARREAEGRRRR